MIIMRNPNGFGCVFKLMVEEENHMLPELLLDGQTKENNYIEI